MNHAHSTLILLMMNDDIFKQVSLLSSVQKRRVAAVIGSLVGDSAGQYTTIIIITVHLSCIATAQPLHWVYDDQTRQQVVSACPDAPEFLVPPANPYYRVPCGSQSPYGDQMMVLLESLQQHKGVYMYRVIVTSIIHVCTCMIHVCTFMMHV